jgi:hypothetical protein
MNPFDLIDRYIDKVGKDLPRKNRLAIEAEIRSAWRICSRSAAKRSANLPGRGGQALTWATAPCVA